MENKEKTTGQTEPIKPMCLKLSEFEAALVKMINTSGIPFYLLEPILHSSSKQVSELANVERAKARQSYEKELEEYNKAETEK